MPICHWQRQIMPVMDFFQCEEGYASTCAWRCCGSSVSYDPDDYPVAQGFAASHAYLRGVYPPNGMDLVERYVEAMGKVFGQAQRIIQT